MVHGLETMQALNESVSDTGTPKDEQWAIVQVMGHTTVIGKMTEEVIAGWGFIRIDVPGDGDAFAFSKLIGGGAIHSIDIVSEEIARKMAKSRGPKAPLSAYELERLKLPAGTSTRDPEEKYDNDFDDHEDSDEPY